MPTYDYLCESCGDKFEEFQSITAKALRKCPKCGKMKLKRLIGSGAGIIFKGSGFYETDYRSDGYKESAKKESPKSESSTDKKDSTPAGDSKPAEKKQPDTPAKTSDNSSKSQQKQKKEK